MPLPFLAAAALASAAISSAGNYLSTSASNSANISEGEKNREFQSHEAALSREWQQYENDRQYEKQKELIGQSQDWQEQMYNKYSSPAAMMEQYKKAGLNPYLAESGQMGSPMSSSSPSQSPGSVGSPGIPSGSQAHVDAFQLQPIDLLGAVQVSSEVANQHAQTVRQLWETGHFIYEKFGKDAFYDFLDSHPEMYHSSDPDNSPYMKQFNLKIANDTLASERAKLENGLIAKYGEEKAASEINKINQEISKIVGEQNVLQTVADLNRSNVDVNSARIKDLAASVAERFAHSELMSANKDLLVANAPFITGNLALQFLRNGMITVDEFADFVGGETERTYKMSDQGKQDRLTKTSVNMSPAVSWLKAYREALISFGK